MRLGLSAAPFPYHLPTLNFTHLYVCVLIAKFRLVVAMGTCVAVRLGLSAALFPFHLPTLNFTHLYVCVLIDKYSVTEMMRN